MPTFHFSYIVCSVCNLTHADVPGRCPGRLFRHIPKFRDKKEYLCDMLKRISTNTTPALNPVPDADGIWKKYPSLWEFLSVQEWPDDKKGRETGTVQFFYQDGYLKAFVNDRDQGVVAYTTLDSSSDFLKQLDVLLEKDKLEWRKAKPYGSRKLKK